MTLSQINWDRMKAEAWRKVDAEHAKLYGNPTKPATTNKPKHTVNEQIAKLKMQLKKEKESAEFQAWFGRELVAKLRAEIAELKQRYETP